MKTNLPPSLTRGQRRAGVALLVTLAMLVLLSGIVIAFMTSVRTDLTTSRSYEESTNARMLADSALNLVIGQIREASTQPQQAWISQPGLIRTFKRNGDPAQAFKLYSAEQLVVDGEFDPAADAASGSGDLPPALPDTDPGHWSKKPALWTDLNEYIGDLTRKDPNDPEGKEPAKVYPIFDGNYLTPGTSAKVGQLSLTGSKTTPDVEGFRVEDYDTRKATMPVKWLYMLKDGTLAGAREKGDGDAELIVPAGKDKTADGKPNPIVARIAFWTDDETAKVNINTASEGTFWDTPVCNTQPGVAGPATGYISTIDKVYEWDLAERMGAINEYQRYPGHPAQTSLSTVFGEPLRRRMNLQPSQLASGKGRMDFVEEIMKIVPRIAGKNYNSSGESPGLDYSSRGGIIRAGTKGLTWNATDWQKADDLSIRRVIADSDRLYATIDELAFMSPVIADITPGGTATEREAQPLAGSGTANSTRSLLEMTKFFLTANSKAPEQNLYNLPRVAVWPVRDQTARRTAFDKLITFCSTVGNKDSGDLLPLIFMRNRPDSQYDWTTIQNNQRVYKYLKALTSRPVPGWKANGANSFADKLGADHEQVLTEIFDYIRCTNLVDQSEPALVSKPYNALKDSAYTNPDMNLTLGGGPPIRNDPSGKDSMLSKRGQVVPIVTDPAGKYRGFGRIATISELALVIHRRAEVPQPAWGKPTDKIGVEAMLLPELFSPMAGFSCLANDIRLKFRDITLSINGNPVFAKTVAGENITQPDVYDVGRVGNIDDHDSKIGGVIGTRTLMEGPWTGQPSNRGAPDDSTPPTADFNVPNTTADLLISGDVTVDIYAPASGAQLVQTITFKFPQTSVHCPLGTNTAEFAISSSTAVTGPSGSKVKGSALTGSQFQDVFNSTNDVVRSVTAMGKNLQGDMRLVAARRVVDGSYFTGSGRYFTPAAPMAHSLRSGWASKHPGAAFGNLVKKLTGHAPNFEPDIPEGVDGVLNSKGKPGDWDNGPAWILDGPMINKADEGTNRHIHASTDLGKYWEVTSPYIGTWYVGQNFDSVLPTFFSPNRQISSPVMFGSLPTGVQRDQPWQTLLFRPAKDYLPGGESHPGGASSGPPDHLLLDLFWMPVVEPYAISEPFATAGKINLNTQIAPFTNIKRNTGLNAVLKAVKITALNPTQQTTKPSTPATTLINDYKIGGIYQSGVGGDGGGMGVTVRRNLDVFNTMRQIEDRLDRNKPFISASEICDIPLIPATMTGSGIVNAGFTNTTPLKDFDAKLSAFWGVHNLTGDNSLERPYSFIYPRLTTRSNSYTVHVRVQTLRKISTDPDKYVFKNVRDQVLGEFRGSFLLERYLDANLGGFMKPDGTPITGSAPELEPDAMLGPYRFRVVSSKQFVP
ncbi:MAG: hypothetical protein QOE70_3057 [Chthoniobacter sp.]|jgi:uncharacterized protein (TIGR02600 family)|nr:hypothetical protein [Chthoniobacter sp.]